MDKERLAHEMHIAVQCAVRCSIVASKLDDELCWTQWRNYKCNGDTSTRGAFICISNHDKSVIGGSGQLLRNFLDFGTLFGYRGEGELFTNVNDKESHTSALKLMSFYEAFDMLPCSVQMRKCFI